MEEHITKSSPSGFAAKYSCTDLIYYEEFNSASDAIIREKQLKGWNRSKKWNLILKLNPELKDLSELI
jgi:putative endonuclease